MAEKGRPALVAHPSATGAPKFETGTHPKKTPGARAVMYTLFAVLLICRLTASSVYGTLLENDIEEVVEPFDAQVPPEVLRTFFWIMTVINALSALGVHSERLYNTANNIIEYCFPGTPKDKGEAVPLLSDGGIDPESLSPATSAPVATPTPPLVLGCPYYSTQASSAVFAALNGLSNFYAMSLLIGNIGGITVGIGYALITANFYGILVHEYFKNKQKDLVVENTHPKTATAMLTLAIINQLSIFYFFISKVLKSIGANEPLVSILSVGIGLLTVPAMVLGQTDNTKKFVTERMKFLCAKEKTTEAAKIEIIPSCPIRSIHVLNWGIFKLGEFLTTGAYIIANWYLFKQLFKEIFGPDNIFTQSSFAVLAVPMGIAAAAIYIANNMTRSEHNINKAVSTVLSKCSSVTPVKTALEDDTTGFQLPRPSFSSSH